MKTDKHILADLPAKIELESSVTLSPSQRSLYAAIHRQWGEVMQESRNSSKNHRFARRGHIFAMLEKMRRVCNHPRCLDVEKYPQSCKSLEVPQGPEGSGKASRLM